MGKPQMENAQGLLGATPASDAISDSEDNWGNAGDALATVAGDKYRNGACRGNNPSTSAPMRSD
jgi:hypothetical protein